MGLHMGERGLQRERWGYTEGGWVYREGRWGIHRGEMGLHRGLTCRAVRCGRQVMAAIVLGVFGEMERERRRRPDSAARPVRLLIPSGVPGTPRWPTSGVTCTTRRHSLHGTAVSRRCTKEQGSQGIFLKGQWFPTEQ